MQGTANRRQGTGSAMRVVTVGAAMAAMLVLAGCRQDMQDQPKFVPQRGTTFYADGRSARPQVENTVARSQMHEDEYFYTGLKDGKEGDGLPLPLTPELMERGQERYNIYCTPCHSRGKFPRGSAAQCAAGPLLQRDDQWLRCDAGVCVAGYTGRSLGYCGLHSCAAVEPECQAE